MCQSSWFKYWKILVLKKRRDQAGGYISKWKYNVNAFKINHHLKLLKLLHLTEFVPKKWPNKNVVPVPFRQQLNIFFFVSQIICGWLKQDSSLVLSICRSPVIALCLAEQSQCFIRLWHIHLSHSLWTDRKAREDSHIHTDRWNSRKCCSVYSTYGLIVFWC